MGSRFTRRQFLARQTMAVGSVALAALLPDGPLLASDGNSAAGSTSATGIGDITFPLKASENHRYLVDARGKPFVLLGDTLKTMGVLP